MTQPKSGTVTCKNPSCNREFEVSEADLEWDFPVLYGREPAAGGEPAAFVPCPYCQRNNKVRRREIK